MKRGTGTRAAHGATRTSRKAILPPSAEATSEKILHSWAYPLPHRAATLGDGNGWSRLTDGDLKSYWKSNPYLTKTYTSEDDSRHPQWVMIDLGTKVDVNAIRIAWANPFARDRIKHWGAIILAVVVWPIGFGSWNATRGKDCPAAHLAQRSEPATIVR